MAIASSYDSTGRYGAQTPFNDQLAPFWAGGQWQVDATHNSIVAITNGGSKQTTARLTLHYNGGTSNYVIEQPIAAGDQMWLNFADLIQKSVPDKNGNKLPAGLTSGTYDLRDLGGENAGSLFEGKVALDKTLGHLAYGCMMCCGYDSAFIDPDSLAFGVGEDAYLTVRGHNACSLEWEDVTQYYDTWSSGDTSIATLSAATAHGVSAGQTQSNASGLVPKGDGYESHHCPREQMRAQLGFLYVRIPFRGALVTTQFSRPNACPAGYAGWDRLIWERVADQFGIVFVRDNVNIEEVVTAGQNGLNLPVGNIQTGSGPTHDAGIFLDEFYFCSSVCGSGGTGETDLTQVLFYGGVPVLLPNSIALRCNSVAWNGQ